MSSVTHFLSSFSEAFSRFAVWAFVLGVAVYVAQPVVRSRAWHNLLRVAFPESTVRFRDVYGAYLAKNGLGEFLPLHGEEVFRVGLMTPRIEGAQPAVVAATVGVELLADLALTLVLVVTTAALGASVVDWHDVEAHPAAPATIAAVVVAGLVAGLIALRRRGRALLDELKQGMLVVKHPGVYARRVLGWQLLDVGLQLAGLYLFLVAFGFAAVPLQSVLLIRTAQRITVSLPGFLEAGSQQAMIMGVLRHGSRLGQAAGFGLGMKVTEAGLDLTLGLIAARRMIGPLHLRERLAGRLRHLDEREALPESGR